MNTKSDKRGKGRIAGKLAKVFATLGLVSAALPAVAEYTFFARGGFKLNGGLTAVGGAIGTDDIQPLERRDSYYEGFLKPNLNFTWDLVEGQGTIYGKISGVGVIQGGDGDPLGATSGDDDDLGLEEAHLGWRGQYVDVKAGKLEFAIGDGFLINDCNFDSEFTSSATGVPQQRASDGSYWVAPYKACDSSVVASFNNGAAWRADAFYIKGDRNQLFTRIGGLNVEYLIGEGGANGKLGAMVAAIPEADGDVFFVTTHGREGMEIFDVRANGVKIPAVPGLTLYGELAFERGENPTTNFDYDAWAGYGEANYTFENVMWTPLIGYRYGVWSGDDNLLDNEEGNFDPLFYYAGYRGWGTWYQGEIAGEYLLFNSNQQTHMVKLQVHPLESLTVTGLYFNHSLDEKNYFEIPVTQTDFMDEFNLIVEWIPIPSIYVAGIVGYGITGDAYEEVFATPNPVTGALVRADDNPAVYEIWVQFTY